ncbi:hypothetical protein GGD66_008022 [Bradyrhizobium sp. CIR48]|nr:hypothetical protein [Bradyrhizobium sp. CIR48]
MAERRYAWTSKSESFRLLLAVPALRGLRHLSDKLADGKADKT